MVKKAVLLFDGGRPVIKSRAVWDQGREGTVSSRRRPAGRWWDSLQGMGGMPIGNCVPTVVLEF